MNWFVWRQHRKQFLIFGILLAAFAAIIIPTGLNFWHTYQQTLTSCAQNPANPTCSDLPDNLFTSTFDQLILHLEPIAILVLPLIFGVFWGSSFLAKEYDEGTNKLAWTQSVSRRKWLTVKLAWMLIATAVLAAIFAGLSTWWSKTPNTLFMYRFDSLHFSVQGIAPVAYSLFSVAFGIMFGAWFRKTMVAIGLTFGLFIAIVFIAVPNFVRPHYMTPITITSAMGPNNDVGSKIPAGAWVLTRNILDGNGKAVNNIFTSAPSQCQKIIQQNQITNNHGDIRVKASPGGGDQIDTCLDKAGFHQVATYQPSYRYWDFQRIETGIFLGMTALAVGTTYRLVLRRDA
jgi:ABC-2 family transporter protein